MFKGFNGFFIYKKPDENNSFELLESPEESSQFDREKDSNKDPENPKTEGVNKDEKPLQDSKREEEQQNRVQANLLQVLKYSQQKDQGNKPQENQEMSPNDGWNSKKNKESVQSVMGTLGKNEQTRSGKNKDSTKKNGGQKDNAKDRIREKDHDNKNKEKNETGHDDQEVKMPRPLQAIPINELLKEQKEEHQKKDEHKKDKKEDRENEGSECEETNRNQSEDGNNDKGDVSYQDNKAGDNKSSNDQKPEDEKSESGENEDKGGQSQSGGNKSKNRKDADGDAPGNKTEDKVDIEDPLVFVNPGLQKNISYLEKIFHMPTNKDVIIREFNVARQIRAFVVFIDGMIDKDIVIRYTLPQLMDAHPFIDFEGSCPLDYIEKNVLTIHQVVRMDKFEEIVPQILSGLTAIFIEGCTEVLLLESRGFEKRSIGSPLTETVVLGSQEGFTENLRTNITLIRRIVKSENLITEFNFVTKTSNIISAVLYMEGIVNPKVVEEVKRRVTQLNVDYVLGAEMVKQLIEDNPRMLFPQIISTERPDRTASFLMDGKVVLICEGTPFALAMPITFFDLYHTSEDANLKWQYGSFLRVIRLFGILLALFLPGMYTALILFHQEMIPTALLASIVTSRKAVPFPSILEILLMEFSFELIREGGIRVPGVTGNTLGIIGALILGQAAVEAGLVSPILIIIVAVSGLGSFAIPNYSLSLTIRIIRFMNIVFGFLAGFYGISAAFTIICSITLGMKSFGVPFFAPISAKTKSNSDKVVRGPIYKQTYRPDYLNTLNEKRMGEEPRGWRK